MPEEHQQQPRPSNTAASDLDSPWPWVLLFTAAALVGLTLIAPKHALRQARLERMYQARQEAIERGEPLSADLPPEMYDPPAGAQLPSLQPLMLVVAAIMVAASLVLQWRQRKRRLAAERLQAAGCRLQEEPHSGSQEAPP